MLFSQELQSFTTIEEVKIFLQKYFFKLKKEKNPELRNLLMAWSESKKIGLIKEADDFLELILEISIKEKRLWALREIQKNINVKNKYHKKIENAVRDISGTEFDIKKEILVSEINEICRRDLKYLTYFVHWLEEYFKSRDYESFKTLYQGILIHGPDEKTLKILRKILAAEKKTKTKTKEKKEIAFLQKPNENMESKHIEANEIINLNFIDDLILQKYSNDILFSLLCLKDYKSIYQLEERLDLSLQKNTKLFLEYYFYKYSSLLEEKKFKKLKFEIEILIFELPLTKKELMPFLYLYAEALMGIGKYEVALNYLLILKNETLFENKANMRINEIKKD